MVQIEALEHSSPNKIKVVEDKETMTLPPTEVEEDCHGNQQGLDIPLELDAAYDLLGFNDEDEGDQKTVVAEKQELINKILNMMESENREEVGEEEVDIPVMVNEDGIQLEQMEEKEMVISKDWAPNEKPRVLGIKQDCQNQDSPDCTKENKRRGRRSLNDLRAKDGLAEDQGKLTNFFNAGKGKVLPNEP